jgi:hypothetical protein
MAPIAPASSAFGVVPSASVSRGNPSVALAADPPSLMLSGGAVGAGANYTDMVGDEVQLFIKAPANQTLTAATVTATNAIGSPVQFSAESGSAPPLAAKTAAELLSNTEAYLAFNWNGTPGTDTINASVTYTGVAAPVNAAQITVNVLAPTFTSYTDTQLPFQFGRNPNNQAFGFFQTGANNVNGNIFAATVNCPQDPAFAASGGTFGFLQTANFNIGATSNTNQIQSFVTQNDPNNPGTSGNPSVVDNQNSQGGTAPLFLSGYVSAAAPAGAQAFSVGANGAAYDSPSFPLNTEAYPNGSNIAKNNYNANFTTYLEYKSSGSGSIWVAIGSLTWSINGSENYSGPFNVGNGAAFQNTANWMPPAGVAKPTPAASSVIPGKKYNGIPTWTNNAYAILHP